MSEFFCNFADKLIIKMNMNTELKNRLESEARYLKMSIPYDKDDESGLISFDDGLMTELECEEDFVPPMLNKEDQLLEYMVDLKERKVLNWSYKDGYLRMWAKVRDSGTYTLLDEKMNPLWQIRGYVPNRLIPPLEDGYGDYIELAVEGDGIVVGWPEKLDFSEFIKEGREPKHVKTNKWHRAEEALWDVRRHNLNKDEMNWLIEHLKV